MDLLDCVRRPATHAACRSRARVEFDHRGGPSYHSGWSIWGSPFFASAVIARISDATADLNEVVASSRAATRAEISGPTDGARGASLSGATGAAGSPPGSASPPTSSRPGTGDSPGTSGSTPRTGGTSRTSQGCVRAGSPAVSFGAESLDAVDDPSEGPEDSEPLCESANATRESSEVSAPGVVSELGGPEEVLGEDSELGDVGSAPSAPFGGLGVAEMGYRLPDVGDGGSFFS